MAFRFVLEWSDLKKSRVLALPLIPRNSVRPLGGLAEQLL